MMGYRPYRRSDIVVKTRLCDECRQVIVGVTDRGLIYWLDPRPLSDVAEKLMQRVGRATCVVNPGPARTADLHWRNRLMPRPSRGLILALHLHQKPGRAKVPDPPWVLSSLTKAIPRDESEVLF